MQSLMVLCAMSAMQPILQLEQLFSPHPCSACYLQSLRGIAGRLNPLWYQCSVLGMMCVDKHVLQYACRKPEIFGVLAQCYVDCLRSR